MTTEPEYDLHDELIDQGMAADLSAPKAEQDQGDKIEAAVRSYRLQCTRDRDDNSLSLVDALTPPGDKDITRGVHECHLLADHIWSALNPPKAEPPADEYCQCKPSNKYGGWRLKGAQIVCNVCGQVRDKRMSAEQPTPPADTAPPSASAGIQAGFAKLKEITSQVLDDALLTEVEALMWHDPEGFSWPEPRRWITDTRKILPRLAAALREARHETQQAHGVAQALEQQLAERDRRITAQEAERSRDAIEIAEWITECNTLHQRNVEITTAPPGKWWADLMNANTRITQLERNLAEAQAAYRRESEAEAVEMKRRIAAEAALESARRYPDLDPPQPEPEATP